MSSKNLNFKVIRIEAGLTQYQLGRKAGVSTSAIARHEAGVRDLTQERAEKVAAVLGTTVENVYRKEFHHGQS